MLNKRIALIINYIFEQLFLIYLILYLVDMVFPNSISLYFNINNILFFLFFISIIKIFLIKDEYNDLKVKNTDNKYIDYFLLILMPLLTYFILMVKLKNLNHLGILISVMMSICVYAAGVIILKENFIWKNNNNLFKNKLTNVEKFLIIFFIILFSLIYILKFSILSFFYLLFMIVCVLFIFFGIGILIFYIIKILKNENDIKKIIKKDFINFILISFTIGTVSFPIIVFYLTLLGLKVRDGIIVVILILFLAFLVVLIYKNKKQINLMEIIDDRKNKK